MGGRRAGPDEDEPRERRQEDHSDRAQSEPKRTAAPVMMMRLVHVLRVVLQKRPSAFATMATVMAWRPLKVEMTAEDREYGYTGPKAP